MKRKFPYGFTNKYRRILEEVFKDVATDEQLNEMFLLVCDIEDDEFLCRQRIDESQAIEWLSKAVAIVRKQ